MADAPAFILMIEPLNSRMIGVLEIALALLIFHRVLPIMVELENRLKIVKFWALGFALGSFGLGRLFGAVYLQGDAWLFATGHWCLITYAALRLYEITRNSQARWWRHP